MRIIKQSARIFLRSRNIIIILLIALLGFLGYLIYEAINWQSENVMWFLLRSHSISIFVFVVCLYISYEYMFKARQNDLDECLNSLFLGSIKSYGFSFLMLLLLSFALFILCTILNIAVPVARGIWNFPYLLHIIKANILNIFVVSLIACLMGTCIAFFCKRFSAYLSMAIIVFIFSPILGDLPVMLYMQYGVDISKVTGLYSSVLPSGFDVEPDYLYGVSIESFRWNASAFWVLTLTGLYIGAFLRRFKHYSRRLSSLLIMLLFVCSAVNLLGFFRGGSSRAVSGSQSIFTVEDKYYIKHEQKESPAEFYISKYKMDLNIDRQLSADVTLTLDNPKLLTTCSFTLYHGYKVKRVCDEYGNELEYQQDSDYFDIFLQHPKKTDTIRIFYEGYNPIYFSNNQGVLLPGFLPYYPREGYQLVYHITDKWKSGYNTKIPNNGEKTFEINIKSSLKVMTNLEVNDGILSGNRACVSLVGGFMEERLFAGYNAYSLVIDSFIDQQKEEHSLTLQEEIIRVEQLVGEENKLEIGGYKIFEGSENLWNYSGKGTIHAVKLSDHIFIVLGVSPVWVAIDLVLSNIPNITDLEKFKGVVFLRNYLQFGGVYMQGLGGEAAITAKLDQLGTDFLLKESYRYLKDTKDERTFEEFIQQLS